MSISKLNLSAIESCEQHSYCPHQHYQRCKPQRMARLPYTYRPIKDINLRCNVHPKRLGAGLTTRNIPTLAYEKYIDQPVLPDQADTNFSKNFYLQNLPEKYQLRNTLLKDTEQALASKNAYTLAAGATEEYNIFAKQREQYLHNARKRAQVAYNKFVYDKKQEKQAFKADQLKWIQNYIRKVEELIDHMYRRKKSNGEGENDDPNVKDRIFLREQQGIDAKILSKIRLNNPKAALDILTSLRGVLLRKKVSLEEARMQQEHNRSVSASCIDSSNVSGNNTTQNASNMSMVSATTAATQQMGQAQFAEQFCDFEKLKKKWNKQDVEQVRNTLRVMLCRDVINKAEGKEMKERKKAREKDEFLRRQMQKMGKGKGQKQTKGKPGQKKDPKAKENKSLIHADQQKPSVPMFKEPLSKEQQVVKTTLLKGGCFDSLGDIYQRNRNYSQLFRKRGQQSMCEFSFRDQSLQQVTRKRKPVQTARTSAYR